MLGKCCDMVTPHDILSIKGLLKKQTKQTYGAKMNENNISHKYTLMYCILNSHVKKCLVTLYFKVQFFLLLIFNAVVVKLLSY